MKTIRQIAEEIGVTKQAIHQKIKKEPLSTTINEFTSTVDGVIYISVDGIKLIKQAFNLKQPQIIDVKKTSTVDGDIVTLLKENLIVLQNQLEEKDRQLNHKDSQISDLTSALVTAQQTAATAQALHAGTIQQQLATSETPSDEQEEEVKIDEITVIKHEKRRFFDWFGRKT
jgi:IS30 family transposase